MRIFREVAKTWVKLLLGRGVRYSYSQFGEDAVLQNLLRGKEGAYVDIGAYHPVLYSNTYAFYKRGWSGIAIDPNPYSENLFKIMRPRDRFILAAVGAPSTRPYFEYDDPACNAIGEPAPPRKDLRLLRTSTVRVEPLAKLLAGTERIDLMNIDIEGMDTEALSTYEWSVFPTVIAVEGILGDSSALFLSEKGYHLAGLAGLTMIFTRNRKS